MKTKSFRLWRIGVTLAGLVALVGLAACGAAPTPTTSQPTTDSSASQPTASTTKAEGQTREDGQGAVTVKVTPLNLENSSATLDFEVVLDTHSVDLSMDLSQLAVLRADTGAEVNASAWPVGSGHHYEGTLSFPAQTAEGRSVLDGATRLTLVIKDVDAPERVFEWSLTQ
jgi:hypothetical protein